VQCREVLRLLKGWSTGLFGSCKFRDIGYSSGGRGEGIDVTTSRGRERESEWRRRERGRQMMISTSASSAVSLLFSFAITSSKGKSMCVERLLHYAALSVRSQDVFWNGETSNTINVVLWRRCAEGAPTLPQEISACVIPATSNCKQTLRVTRNKCDEFETYETWKLNWIEHCGSPTA